MVRLDQVRATNYCCQERHQTCGAPLLHGKLEGEHRVLLEVVRDLNRLPVLEHVARLEVGVPNKRMVHEPAPARVPSRFCRDLDFRSFSPYTQGHFPVMIKELLL